MKNTITIGTFNQSHNMKTLILDNYDSFTYNLYQYISELSGDPIVKRNDEVTLDDIEDISPTHIIISPGPGHPDNKKDFGVCSEVISNLKIPILGVCLGHQGICSVFGGKIKKAPEIVHGKSSQVRLTENAGNPDILKGLPSTFKVMRYHSLVADKDSLPDCLKITAETFEDGLVMAVRHKVLPIYGLQFHPESVGTEVGKYILRNFLNV